MSAVPTPDAALTKLATQAYVYGYPLVYNLNEVRGFTSGAASLPVNAPFNELVAARALLGPETEFVSPNNDTLYLLGALDLRSGPQLLHVPDTAGRYYVLQFVDAWTNNFAYIGKRATGTGAGDFLIAGPRYDGPVPEGARLVVSPTGICMIVGRLQVDGDADVPAVHAVQDAFTLTSPQADETAPPAGIPTADPAARENLTWWETLRVELAAFAPPEVDAPMLAAFAALGITAADSPYVDPDPALEAALLAGATAGQAMIEELAKGAGMPVNGWVSAMHLFDYNDEFLGLGTVGGPEWTIADRTIAYATRAAVARAGLWGNHGYEADYEIVYVDADGEQLNGAHRYELHLPELPPVDAFWSLTMYNVPRFLLEANPIDRYSIGDRTPGLKRSDDGSVTIFLQADAPGGEKDANWLPTPADDFRPIMRLYMPKDEVLRGDYHLPAITRVDSR